MVSGDGAPELNVDDNIRVVFNGEIMESYSVQLGTVYAIYLLDENGEAIPNDENFVFIKVLSGAEDQIVRRELIYE